MIYDDEQIRKQYTSVVKDIMLTRIKTYRERQLCLFDSIQSSTS